ncbi:unnamed protein product [Acanthoscelides obtectus]|uniref:Uncharacterized protein n=1 Tax=Acanthoscelides obtectus TaxID=200917 RepID=A0A9P0NWY8_ACAOB|nr:unnamed protein product [Acanthoscelides obtectus]CAK1633884.1 hypothetical protein AOBTE_LOCUS8459 [Acanthoscelides obtectus]
MPLTTSDFRNPVCLEMKVMSRAQQEVANVGSAGQYGTTGAGDMDNMGLMMGFPEVDVDRKPANGGTAGADLHSMDSSDTFASCTTNPFNSQGDLTGVECNGGGDKSDSNLYVNPLDKSGENSPVTQTATTTVSTTQSGVKKSASGDTALRSLGTSPMDEGFKGFGALDRGSRVSLNDSPVTKHRKTRFQGRPRTRFGDSLENNSQESLEKKKKTSFMATRGLTSATRILNQHLFGFQNLSIKSGKNSGSKSTLSVDSLDSRTSPQLEQHRRSKSILKKSDSSGGNRHHNAADPESERLIPDNMSAFEVDYSPNKRLSSPPTNRRITYNQKVTKNLPSYQQELERTRLLKSQLFLLDDILSRERQAQAYAHAQATCNETGSMEARLRSAPHAASGDNGGTGSAGEVPLYICPPPPPMEGSPTEETRLLYSAGGQNQNRNRQQPTNSIVKGLNPSS